MVMLLSKAVPGESIYLFATDPGVPDSETHPFRVARFTNRSGGLLERGPIAVFENGAFLGQGMVDQLPEAIVSKLKAAWDIRSVLVLASNQRAKLSAERRELESATQQTRENVRALEKNRVAGDLRNQLVERLAKDSLRLEAITRETIEADQQLAEARVRFRDIVRSIKLTMPPQVAPGE